MNDKTTVMQRLEDQKVVAILRGVPPSRVRDVAMILVGEGITNIEVTFSTFDASRSLEELVAMRKETGLLVGAGTVVEAETARAALFSGADFIVAPHFVPEVIEFCHRYDKVVIPGAFSPTEVAACGAAGATYIKLFPAQAVGPSYLKSLLGPYPWARLMVTGGITPENGQDYLKAGARILGVGGYLTRGIDWENPSWDLLKERVARIARLVGR
mgnify:CR=1 FL=1